MNITGHAATPGNINGVAVAAGAIAPHNVTSSTVPADHTAPEIDALDLIVPYGTSLRPDEMASITDDQDESPKLEIDSVREITSEEDQNTDAANDGTTLPATASTGSTADLFFDTSEAAVPIEEPVTEDVIIATTAATAEIAAEVEPVDTGYLFSTPGKYSVVLKGTDKSGNEAAKTITVTVIDNVAPVFGEMPKRISIKDKDKKTPDYLKGITATDEIDGDITASVEVDDSAVQYGKAGKYSVSYSVSDTSGNIATATTPVVIKDTTAPYVAVIESAFSLFVTDKKPNYASYVTAIDSVDGDVKNTLTVDDSAVKYKTPGEYSAKLSVKDKSGNVAEKNVKVSIAAGWKTQDGKKYFYSLKDGHLYHSWSHIDDKVYYFDPDDGHMLTGAQTIDGKQYLLDEKDGYQITGWQTIDGKKYFFSTSDGHMYHSWSHIDDKEYYFDPGDGHLLTGAQTIDGKQYLLDEKDGHQISGWQTVKGKVYYYSPDDGHMYHSWSNIGGKEYYFNPASGAMMTGLLTVDGDQYLMDEKDGHELTGWQTIDGKKYYFSKNDGHMYHDWSNIDGTEYYFDKSDGHMYTGRHTIDGEEYDFGTSGIATKVAQTRSSGGSGSSGTRNTYGSVYIGNRNSHKFHYASCSSVRQMKDKNKVEFDSRSEAINAGYVPCQRCNP